MDIQSTLTLAIEVVFWAFVSLMIFDLTNRLFILDTNIATAILFTRDNILSSTPVAIPVIAPQIESECERVKLELESQQLTTITPQFEQLPDPWKLDVETPTPSIETQGVVLTFPTLRLLPPVKEVQSKRSKNQHKATSTKKPKSAPGESPRKPGRPRKQTA